jgi:hypothetical protein
MPGKINFYHLLNFKPLHQSVGNQQTETKNKQLLEENEEGEIAVEVQKKDENEKVPFPQVIVGNEQV